MTATITYTEGLTHPVKVRALESAAKSPRQHL
jgi:hypothetical protein